MLTTITNALLNYYFNENLMYKTKELRIPANYYMTDNMIAIKSLLGCNTKIIEYSTSDVILPNNEILVYVKYQSLVVGEIYLINPTDVKLFNEHENKYIVNIEGSLVYILDFNKSTKSKFLIKLYSYPTSGLINYYGIIIKNSEELFNSYSSVLSPNKEFEITFDESTIATTLFNNEFKFSKDVKSFEILDGQTKNQSNGIYNYSVWKNKNDFIEIKDISKLTDEMNAICLVDDYEKLKSKLQELKYGILILINTRSCPNSFIYLQSDLKLKDIMINNLVNLMKIDCHNYKLMKSLTL